MSFPYSSRLRQFASIFCTQAQKKLAHAQKIGYYAAQRATVACNTPDGWQSG
ncbi:MAG: hypothetical protein IJB00_05720 [Akkermansia sp.]|nr:hypothetical protein [Akkermansia sp.]